MKKIIFLLLALFSISVNAQTKKPSITKPSKSEIDILYDKYKDTENINLLTPLGDLYGNIIIKYNSSKKPASIRINGISANKAMIASFISNTIIMKINQGYKPTDDTFLWGYNSYSELIKEGSYVDSCFKSKQNYQLLMRKENMYFRVNAKCCERNEEGYMSDNYTWEIETGDTKRQGVKNATNFEF